MLSLALAATLVGFGLLVVALVTSNLPLAIACVVVCVIGLILLIVDTLRANRRGGTGAEDEPLFTIRGRESAAREEPLDEDADSAETVAAETAHDDEWHEPEAEGLGSIVSTPQEPLVDQPTDPGNGELSSLAGTPEPEGVPNGDVNDYLRATGSFPAASPVPPQTPPTSGEPAGYAEDRDPQQPADPYVGRRRLAGDPTDDIVVRSSDPDLPAMQFVWEDPSESTDGGKPKGDSTD
ncbi:hypothetical protein [Gordonia neofelifaecis]|uniref:Transmembrane protein n=1 Tax=Gordonia neofelifaecis NRRL B-59395 TaxID=644548 RepID=F1YHN2_9ACTN|nr:hypothetical protein [Gordonia neofelifaecis]EGD55870.1 hypothetical protein SCNU_06500 [Gordonia neofelifaecis NRRL B-59395]